MFSYVQESGSTTTSMMSKIMKYEIPIKSRPARIHQNSSCFFFFLLFDVLDSVQMDSGSKSSWTESSWKNPQKKKQGPNVFGSCDFLNGFHQAPIEEDTQEYTAFTCFMGIFQFTRLPFGPKRAPAYFQEVMTSIVLAGLIYHICEMYTFLLALTRNSFLE